MNGATKMKKENLKKVSLENFARSKTMDSIRENYDRENYDALDILSLDGVRAKDKIRIVACEEFLPEMLLHEYGCRCAEWALAFVKIPKQSSIDAILTKRRWISGDATDAELLKAWRAAWNATLEMPWGSSMKGELAAARSVAFVAEQDTVRAASLGAAEKAAEAAVQYGLIEEKTIWKHLLNILRNLINEWEE